jgi:hypothetical protein
MLTAGRLTPRRSGEDVGHPVAAATTIYAGAMVALLTASGYAVPAGTAASGACVGVAQADADNSGGADGAINVNARKGAYRFDNSASADLIARTSIGVNCYIVDDHTVAKTDSSGTRKVAGVVVDVDSAGVWVKF